MQQSLIFWKVPRNIQPLTSRSLNRNLSKPEPTFLKKNSFEIQRNLIYHKGWSCFHFAGRLLFRKTASAGSAPGPGLDCCFNPSTSGTPTQTLLLGYIWRTALYVPGILSLLKSVKHTPRLKTNEPSPPLCVLSAERKSRTPTKLSVLAELAEELRSQTPNS